MWTQLEKSNCTSHTGTPAQAWGSQLIRDLHDPVGGIPLPHLETWKSYMAGSYVHGGGVFDSKKEDQTAGKQSLRRAPENEQASSSRGCPQTIHFESGPLPTTLGHKMFLDFKGHKDSPNSQKPNFALVRKSYNFEIHMVCLHYLPVSE